MSRTTTVDMMDRVEEIRETHIPRLKGQKEHLLQKAEEEYENPWDIPQKLEQEYENVDENISRIEGEADLLEEYADEWDGSKFVIRALTVGIVGMIQDDVAEVSGASFDGGGTPKQGYARKRTIEAALVDSPPGCPGNNPEDLPDAIGDWLYDAIDRFNSTGETSMGNSSLREELIEKRARSES